MKTENLTRKEAYRAMIDGFKVAHPSFDKGQFVYAEEVRGRVSFFFESNTRGSEPLGDAMSAIDGYFIFKPEPKFKEVVMYRALIKAGDYSPLHRASQYASIYLHESKEDALGAKSAIGYTEEKVFIKEDGDS